jgi:beta-lactamase regulating signal transducer with metallopeptidase domain/predicted  nucleic acid-binding Zn-ribbon protein
MENLFTFFTNELQYAIGWTVIHSLWQATLIAILAGITTIFLRKKTAQTKYLVHNIALFAVLLSAIVTFNIYYSNVEQISSDTPIVPIISNDNAQAINFENIDNQLIVTGNNATTLPLSIKSLKTFFDGQIYIVVLIWLLGMGLFLLKLLGGISYVYYLRSQHNFPVDEYWSELMEDLTKKLNIKRQIALVESALVSSPVVVGYLKPMILFPLGVINKMNTEEVEAVLAHEIAHIVRHDYVFNVIQSLIEALFYFNPAVWWLSSNIRNERENCCDDIAIQLCGSSMTYAKSLVAVQEMQLFSPNFAMGFAGQRRNQLFERIQRILNQSSSKTSVMEKLFATTFIIISLIAYSFAPQNVNNNQNSSPDTTILEQPEITTQVGTHTTIQPNLTPLSHLSPLHFDSTKPRFYSPLPTTSEIEKLKQELADMEAQLPAWEQKKEAEIAEKEKELAEMTAKIGDYEKKKEAEIKEIEADLAKRESNTPSVKSGNEERIAKIQKHIAEKEQEVIAFEKEIAVKNAKIKERIEEKKKEKAGKTGSDLASINGDIQGLRGDIQGNLGELQGMRGEIQGLYGEIQGIKGEEMGYRGELQGKRGEIQGKRGEIQGRRGEMQGKRGEIQGKHGEIMGRHGEIQGKAGEIQGKIANQIYKALIEDLKADNIITSENKLIVRLSATEFYVNDVKQSDDLFAKYKAKYIKIEKFSIYIMKRNGSTNISISDDDEK